MNRNARDWPILKRNTQHLLPAQLLKSQTSEYINTAPINAPMKPHGTNVEIGFDKIKPMAASLPRDLVCTVVGEAQAEQIVNSVSVLVHCPGCLFDKWVVAALNSRLSGLYPVSQHPKTAFGRYD